MSDPPRKAPSASRDRLLVEEFLRGDPESLERFAAWIRYAAAPFRPRLGRADFEDLTQDVLVRLTESLRRGAFRGESSLETYVRRATSYACIDRFRRGRRWRMVGVDDLALRSSEPTPFERARDGQRLGVFARILGELPSHCRELWSMIVDGLSYEAMGERLGVRPGTLRVRVLRCRRRAEEFRAAMEAEGAASATAGVGNAEAGRASEGGVGD